MEEKRRDGCCGSKLVRKSGASGDMFSANSRIDQSAVMAAAEGRKCRDGCCRIDESAVMAAAEGTERRDGC